MDGEFSVTTQTKGSADHNFLLLNVLEMILLIFMCRVMSCDRRLYLQVVGDFKRPALRHRGGLPPEDGGQNLLQVLQAQERHAVRHGRRFQMALC